jgi:2'-5' RNA ligase
MRAFIAIEIPFDIKDKAVALQDDLPSEGIKPVERENLHITLRFLGDIDERKAAEIKSAISAVKFEPFAANCLSVGVFPSEDYIRVVWMGVESSGNLEKIAEELDEKLAGLGFAKEKFAGHLTIARVKKKLDLKDFLSKHKNDFFGEFKISPANVKLKKSQLTPQGPIYADL